MKRILSFAFSFLSLSVLGQTNISPGTMKLIQDAIHKDYELANSQLEINKTDQDIKKAHETYVPKVNATAAYAYLDNKLTIDLPAIQIPGLNLPLPQGDQTFHNTSNLGLAALNTQMVLFSGMQVTYGSKALNEKKKAQQHLSDAKRLDIAEDVINTIDQIALLQQSKVLLDESRIRLDKEVLRVNRAIENGLATPYERKKIEVALNQLASRQEEYEGKKALLYSKLEMLTAHPMSELEQLVVSLKPWLLNAAAEEDIKPRSEILALEAGEHAADYQIKMQKAKILPQVVGMASFGYVNLFNNTIRTPFANPLNGQDIAIKSDNLKLYPNWIAGIGLKWDIFSGFSRTRELNKLYMDKTIAENRRKDISEKLDLLREKSRTEYRTAIKQMSLKSAEKVLAESTLDLAVKSYQQGLLPVSERLAAETGMQQAQLEYLQSIYNQRKAAIQYLKASGNFSLQQNSNNSDENERY